MRWYERPAGWGAALLLIIVITGGAYLQITEALEHAAKPISTPTPEQNGDRMPVDESSTSPIATPVFAGSIASAIDAEWARLHGGPAKPADLAELRRRLLVGDPRQTMAAIRAFLATGRDAPTDEAFAIGDHGGLAGAPTLRVLLMDLLGQIAARTGSDEAARLGREVLNTRSSADEWAVSLRNVGQHEPTATAFLADKAREMLTYAPWKSTPSGGFLESFDVPVFTADASFAPILSALSRDRSVPLKRAATVALDRLSEANPQGVMDYLNAHPSEFAERPFLRADYYGKADLSKGPQRDAVELYLTRPDVAADVKAKVISSLASPASFISDALLSSPAVRLESPARQNAVPVTLQAWSKDDRFSGLRAVILQTLQQIAR